MPDIERQIRQERAERLVRERSGRNKYRNGIPSKDAPRWRDFDWTLVAIIAVGVLVVGGFVAMVVVRGIQRLP